MIKTSVIIGASGTAITVVTNKNIAIALGSGDLPVFSTPSMIALMEEASAKVLKEFLEDTAASVGIMVNIEHLAASGLGAKITATARVESVDGRKIVFSVTAKDEKQEIGKGSHVRFIVDKEKFINKLS